MINKVSLFSKKVEMLRRIETIETILIVRYTVEIVMDVSFSLSIHRVRSVNMAINR